ncbi:MAG: hypothetical protein SFY68_00385 [Candidatus Sumerlaeia bacterium]|nr:hypothetical protein [Candidatus Sumerlaeia bacterium]
MMATDQSPETLARVAATQKRIAKVRQAQESNMLTALVFALLVAGITGMALVGTWMSKHAEEIGLTSGSGKTVQQVEHKH